MIRRILPILLLALLAVLLFWDLLWLPAGQAIAGNDLSHMFLQWWQFALQSVRQGELPLWNPYLFSGAPFLANPEPALLYPPVWLVLLLAPSRAAGLLFVAHLWLAGAGMFAWLQHEGADRTGAFFGAVAFAFSGYFFARIYAGHAGVVMTQAWLPLILLATRRAILKQSGAWAMWGGIPVALSLLAGNTAAFFYVAPIQALYALYLIGGEWREKRGWRILLRGVGRLACLLAVGGGLAAVQLLPTLEFLRLSTRQEATYAFASSYSWSPGNLLTLLVPNFFGEPVRTGYWGDGLYEELIYYSGILPLFLALVLGFRLRHRRAALLLVLAGVGLLLALGPFTILHRLAYNLVPPFRAARAPARAGFLFTFAVAALAGLSLTALRQRLEDVRPTLRRWLRGPVPRLVVLLALLVILAGFLLYMLQRDSNPEVGRLWHVANSTALFLLFFLLMIGLLHAWQAGQLDARWAPVLAIALVLIDLWSFGRPLLQPTALADNAYWRAVGDLAAEEEGRVLPWGLGVFEQNYGMALGLESVFGYDPLELARYHRLTTSVPDPRARAYDLLHVRYLAAWGEMDFPAGEDAPRLLGQRDGVWVYERPTALPRAWLVHQVEVLEGEALLARLNEPGFDPRSVALLEQEPGCPLAEADEAEGVLTVERGNNRLELEVAAAAPGLLVLSEPYYPGWRATVDGEPLPLLQVDYALRGVCVPAGEHRIVLTFLPPSLLIGLAVSLLALLLVGWAGWRVWRDGKRPG
ncbi:MAG: YfhO family protein [Anaerolineae bacterium]|nr:YfhO family protein [Anaerolineae bacterium]